MGLIDSAQDLIDRTARRVAWLPPLVARVVIGYAFMRNGWGKLHSLDDITSFFTELGIPLPGVNAAFVSGLEFVGGILLMAGLATRVVSVLLIGTMAVAILTAQRANIHGLADLGNLVEFAFAAVFLYLAVGGAGRVSLDHLLGRKLAARSPGKTAAAARAASPT